MRKVVWKIRSTVLEYHLSENAVFFAQWIGSANVIRNAKIRESDLSKDINQAYSHLKKKYAFMKNIPVQILRNSISELKTSFTAAEKGANSAQPLGQGFKLVSSMNVTSMLSSCLKISFSQPIRFSNVSIF